MKKNYLLMGLLLASVVVATGCSSDSEGNGEDERVVEMLPETYSIELTQEQRDFVVRNNDFSFNLANAVSQQAGKGHSILVSPISVTYNLGMLNAGANGETAKEITQMLGFGADDVQAVNNFCKKLIEEAPKADPTVSLTIANYIGMNSKKGIELENSYRKDMADFYHAEVASLDFSSAGAVRTINDWCSQKTDGMISSMVDYLDSNSLLVLLNAINFKATWTNKFDEKDTSTELFTEENGNSKNLPMMHRKSEILYGQNETYASLLLPYGGAGRLWNMTVLLPNEGKTVDDVLASLHADSWKGRRDEMMPMLVDIKIPRFTTTSDNDLINPIKALGAPMIFREDADFSKMCGKGKNVFVGMMRQKAKIEVNEKGTQATAVTLSGLVTADMSNWKPEFVDFHANRPFVYVIQEMSSGAIFFIGTFRGA